MTHPLVWALRRLVEQPADLLREPYVVLIRTDHALAAEPQVALASLADEHWIDDDLHDTTCGRILRTAWRAAGFNPRFVARASDHHAAIAFVAAFAVVPAAVMRSPRSAPPGRCPR